MVRIQGGRIDYDSMPGTSGEVIVTRISGETVQLASGIGPILVSLTGEVVVTKVSGETVQLASGIGPILVSLTGEVVVTKVSGETVQLASGIGPILASISGETVLTAISGETVIAKVSGETVISKVSGETVIAKVSGEAVSVSSPIIARPMGGVHEKGAIMTGAGYATVCQRLVTNGKQFQLAKTMVSSKEDVYYKLLWNAADISPEIYVPAKTPLPDWYPWNYETMVGDGVKTIDLQARTPPGGTNATCNAEIVGEEV